MYNNNNLYKIVNIISYYILGIMYFFYVVILPIQRAVRLVGLDVRSCLLMPIFYCNNIILKFTFYLNK